MDRDTLLKLAREAGFQTFTNDHSGWPLVQPAGQGCIVEMEKFAALVAAHEREACAQVCEAHFDHIEHRRAEKAVAEASGAADKLHRMRHLQSVNLYNAGLRNAAQAIRDRGTQGGGHG